MRALFAAIFTVSLAAGVSTQALADGMTMPMAHGTMQRPGADGTMEHMDHNAMPGHDAAAIPLADGQVKKVDKAGAKLTISHGPLPNGMPAMTMVYAVKEPAWLNSLKEGQKIRFAAEEKDGAWIVVRLEPFKPR